MATIIKRKLKQGVSYRIQVRLKNKGTGEYETMSTTWQRPEHMTEREVKRALEKFANEYEESLRAEYEVGLTRQKELTVNEYAKKWLSFLQANRAPSYYASVRPLINEVCESLGGYRLKELNPAIIQKYINSLRNKKIVNVMGLATGLKEEMTKQGYSQEKLAKVSGVSTATISAAIEGRRIEIDKAKMLAKALCKPIGELFQVIKDEKPYEKSSLAKRCRTLRAMLSMAKKQQYIEQNYARSEYIDTIRDEKKEKKFLDDKQAKQLIEGLKNYRDIRIKTALMTLLFTGIRRGELSGLEWGDIDLEEQTISIRRSCCQVTGMGIVTGDTKTQSSRRTIAIPQALVQILREYKEWWIEYTKSLGDRYDGIQRLFIQADSKQLYPSTIAYWLSKTLDELGIEQVNVHSLRHTNISLQIAAGVPLKTVSARAGHSTTKVTADIYAHMIQSSDRAAADKLGEILG